MNNDFQEFNKNVPNLYSHIVKSDETQQDPVSTFLKILHSGKELKVNMPSTEDKEFYETDKSKKKGVTEVDFKNTNTTDSFRPVKVPHLGYTRSPSYPTAKDKYVLGLLHNVPVFSVVNGIGEIIISSPRSLKTLNFFDWVYEKYYNNFIWEKDEGPVNLALYFMNEEDAKLYLHEICLGDPKGVKEYGLGIRCSGLDKYYHLNKTAPPKTQIKLVADLKEVDTVINYIKKKSPKVNPKQQYTFNSFKGTPIYIVRATTGYLGFLGTDNLTGSPEYGPKYKNSPFERVYFNKKFAEYEMLHMSHTYSPKSTVEIYNLENYLSELQAGEKSTCTVMFDLSSDLRLESQRYPEFKDTFETKMKSLRRFCKGVVWLVTSDALPTGDNSW
jgi:hypothetical protein